MKWHRFFSPSFPHSSGILWTKFPWHLTTLFTQYPLSHSFIEQIFKHLLHARHHAMLGHRMVNKRQHPQLNRTSSVLCSQYRKMRQDCHCPQSELLYLLNRRPCLCSLIFRRSYGFSLPCHLLFILYVVISKKIILGSSNYKTCTLEWYNTVAASLQWSIIITTITTTIRIHPTNLNRNQSTARLNNSMHRNSHPSINANNSWRSRSIKIES